MNLINATSSYLVRFLNDLLHLHSDFSDCQCKREFVNTAPFIQSLAKDGVEENRHPQ
jgi:hypothetical protein